MSSSGTLGFDFIQVPRYPVQAMPTRGTCPFIARVTQPTIKSISFPSTGCRTMVLGWVRDLDVFCWLNSELLPAVRTLGPLLATIVRSPVDRCNTVTGGRLESSRRRMGSSRLCFLDDARPTPTVTGCFKVTHFATLPHGPRGRKLLFYTLTLHLSFCRKGTPRPEISETTGRLKGSWLVLKSRPKQMVRHLGLRKVTSVSMHEEVNWPRRPTTQARDGGQ